MTVSTKASNSDLWQVGQECSSSPLVSIIISNYNYERFIAVAIETSLKQTYGRVEVVVVDDGSTDGSQGIIKSFEGDSRLKICFQENGGQASAINKGFELSSGEIIVFLDSDDYLKPNAVSEIVASWTSDLSHLQFPLEIIDEFGVPIGLHPFSLHMEDGDIHWQMVVAGNYRFMPTSGNAFSRSALQRILPMPADEWKICADTYLATITPKSGLVKNLQSALAMYRIHGRNNWYSEVRGDDKKKTIWGNHVRTWRALVRHIQPRPGKDAPLSTRTIRDRAALYQHRRILVALRIFPEAFERRDRKGVLRHALKDLAIAVVPTGHKLLYLTFFAMMAAGGWNSQLVRRWIVHGSARPAALRKIIEFLKGRDFYGWMRMRALSAPPAPLPIGVLLRFGCNGGARALQWYGWTRSDQYLDWCIGAEAALICAAPDTKKTLLVELEALPFIAGIVKAQRLEIVCNEQTVHRASLVGRGNIQFELPSRLWQGRSRLEIRLITPDFAIPRLVKHGAEDYRPLSIAFSWIKFSFEGEDQQVTRSPFLPVGDWIDLNDAQCGRYMGSDWRRTEDGVMRMMRRATYLHCSILQPSAGDHLLSLEFARERSTYPIEVKLGERHLAIDLSRRSRADMLLPRGTLPKSGMFSIAVISPIILGAGHRGFAGDSPAGPGLRRIRLRLADQVARLPIFQSGGLLDFRPGGNGRSYLESGWHAPDRRGVASMDTLARLHGIWFDAHEEAFLTAQVEPAGEAKNERPQQLRILCNGALLARYQVEAPCEITAIVPPGLISANFRACFEFQTSSLVAGEVKGPAGFVLTSLVLS